MVEAAPRLSLTPGQETGCDDDGVHRTGARAAEGIKREVLRFEQAVEHAPGKCSKRAAPLEGQRKAPFSRSGLVNSHNRRGHGVISVQVGGGKDALPGPLRASGAQSCNVAGGVVERAALLALAGTPCKMPRPVTLGHTPAGQGGVPKKQAR